MSTHITTSDVTTSHLARSACLYVRRAVLPQVAGDSDDLRPQLDLRRRALAVGWAQEQVFTIDSDVGRSRVSTAGQARISAPAR